MSKRVAHDSLGEVEIEEGALFGAQTQRALDNFKISNLTIPQSLLRALALIKATAAKVNGQLGALEPSIANEISNVALEIAKGKYADQFPLDVFQTGSGTSWNMNANEVIAELSAQKLNSEVHPNDHVNKGQSSNDVIPTSIHVAACLLIKENLLPALSKTVIILKKREQEFTDVVITGRTHLMDAMPVTLAQMISGWRTQLENAQDRINESFARLSRLSQGGTAVGTGINTHPDFAKQFVVELSKQTGVNFSQSPNFFEGISSQDAAVEMSGQLKALATALMKIANDLRWLNSGPLAGIGEIQLPILQPGSSIMPGKVNPVIPEAICMMAAQVTGNDTTITIAGQSGNFQLNVMLPVIGYNLCQSIEILSGGLTTLTDKALEGFTINKEKITRALAKNPILVTALNDKIGYEKGAAIAKKAYAENRDILEVATEMTDLNGDELEKLLDPKKLTGIQN